MLLRNIAQKEGLCNGTRLIVRGIHRHFLDCEVGNQSSHRKKKHIGKKIHRMKTHRHR